jgi:phosphoglycerate dehydrogenase-like enzyme
MTDARAIHVVLADDDPVTRVIGLAAQMEPSSEQWLRTYFGAESFDPLQSLASLRLRLGDVRVTVSHSSDWPSADVIVTRRGRLDAELLDACRRLRLVVKLGRWASGIDVEAAEAAGAVVVCIPRRTLALTAEHTVMLMLAAGKRLRQAQELALSGHVAATARPLEGTCYDWVGLSDFRGLTGETVGLLGFGEVGREVARCLRGFSARVIYWQRERVGSDLEQELSASWADLDELLSSSAFVSLHLPMNESTIGFMDGAKFARMRPGSIFVNTSRGRLVDENALLGALTSGRLMACGLDVHAHEPAELDDLRRLPTVVVTPHIAGGERSGILSEAVDVLDRIAALTGSA